MNFNTIFTRQHTSLNFWQNPIILTVLFFFSWTPYNVELDRQKMKRKGLVKTSYRLDESSYKPWLNYRAIYWYVNTKSGLVCEGWIKRQWDHSVCIPHEMPLPTVRTHHVSSYNPFFLSSIDHSCTNSYDLYIS